eukprot:Skav203319  [mRNA]  locus=scaffold284:12701:16677:- [translate_table: standard]
MPLSPGVTTPPQPGHKAPLKIEIVSTAVATDLLVGAGTGACPEGATMDLLKPRICPPGEGLQMTRQNAVPCARAVVVPPGAALEATARLKEGRLAWQEAVQAEEEAKMREYQEHYYKLERDATNKTTNGSTLVV